MNDKKVFNIQKLAIFNTLLVWCSFLIYFVLKGNSPIEYPDFITGYVTTFAMTKLQDLIVMPIVVISVFIIFIVLVSFFKKLNSCCSENGSKVSYHVVLWSLPCFSVLCSLVLNNQNFSAILVVISFVGILIVTLYSFFTFKNEMKADIAKVSIGFLMVLFISLIPLSFAISFNFVFFGLTSKYISVDYVEQMIFYVFYLSFSIYIYSIFFRNDYYNKNLNKVISIVQVMLPPFFLTLYPAKLLELGEELTSYDTSFLLNVLVLSLMLLGFIDIAYRYHKYKLDVSISNLISPFAFIALIIALKYGNTSVPGISIDDYHFGEGLLGWWMYLRGAIPYIDFIPSHGLIGNDLAGFLNVIFYDGTAASIVDSERLAFALISIALFFAIFISTKSILMAFLTTYFIGGRVLFLFLTIFAVVWFNSKLIKDKVKWSVVWFATAPIVVLGVPPQGLLLVAASSVIPIWYLWVTVKNKDWNSVKLVVISFIVIATAYVFTPLGEMLFFAIDYVLVNGPINQIAYGVPWSISFNNGNFVFEIVRMTWVLVPIGMLFALYFLYQENRFHEQLVLPLFVTFLFAFLLIPYSMGRIDPGSVSRPGLVGMVLITGFMSLTLYNVLKGYNRIWLFFVMVCLTSLLNFTPFSFAKLTNTSSAFINVPHLRDTANTKLANIGHSQVQEEHWIRLNSLASVLDGLLEDKESYLDLTSRNAQYFYLNRAPLIPVTAAYNMPSLEQQINAISLLEKNMPRLALLEGDNIVHDGGGLALRNHYLYRFVIDNYEPVEVNGFVIGLSKEALRRGDWSDLNLPSRAEQIDLFEKAFSRSRVDLVKLPVSWGLSYDSLASKMERVLEIEPLETHQIEVQNANSYKVTGPDPFIVYDLSPYYLSGQDAGLLKFDFSCSATDAEPKVQIYWWGEEQAGASEGSSLFFTAENGTVIVPLDSAPRWYLLNNIENIRIDLHDASACASFSIQNVALYNRS